MFGQAMPVMILLGLINLLVFYFIEKHALARYFKKPPNYKLNIN